MTQTPINRDDWRERAKAWGLPLPVLAKATGKSARTVRAYAYGQLRPPDAWIVRVDEVFAVLEGRRAA